MRGSKKIAGISGIGKRQETPEKRSYTESAEFTEDTEKRGRITAGRG
jgi:hypothetical protein